MKSMETEAAIELISQELGGNAPSIQEEDTDIHYIWSVADAPEDDPERQQCALVLSVAMNGDRQVRVTPSNEFSDGVLGHFANLISEHDSIQWEKGHSIQ